MVGITDAERRLDQYPHQFSGGMRQRVMIAIGLACNPKLIIADEPTTALDVTIQAQILELMKDLSRRLGIALIIITHNLGIVARYADRVNVMYAARIVEQGTADDVFLRPRHPYTMGLLRSVPRLDRPRGAQLETIEGLPPNLLDAARRAAASRRAARTASTICAQRPAARARSSAAIAPRAGARPRCAAGRRPALGAASPIAAREALRRRRARRCSRSRKLQQAFRRQVAAGGCSAAARATVRAVDGRLVRRSAAARRWAWSASPAAARPRSAALILRLEEADRRRDPLRGRRHRRHRAPPSMRDAAPQDPGDLPGSLQLAQSAHDGRRRSSPSRCNVYRLVPEPRRRARTRRRAADPGRPVPVHGRALSARALGRPAPARRHRARARACEPRFIVCDEPVSALDVSIQGQIINLLEELQARLGLTYLFIAHDLAVVRHISDRVAVMYLGRVMEIADRDDALREPAASLYQGAARRGARAGPGGRARRARRARSAARCRRP